jgi:hypothetical protein
MRLQALFGGPLVPQLFDDPKQDRYLAPGDLAEEVGVELVELRGQAVTSRNRLCHLPVGPEALLIGAAGGALSGDVLPPGSDGLLSDEPKGAFM